MIYLLRHGLDDEDYIGGYSSATLVPTGIKQVIDARKFIESNKLDIRMIYTSDIARALETTEIVNKNLKLDYIIENNLRELDKGDLTGLKKDLAYKHYPEYKSVSDIYKKYPNGEAMIDLYKRVKSYLENINFDNTLLVTHRGVINMIYYILNDIKLDMDKERFGVVHASVHKLDLEKRKIKRIY